MPEIFFTSDHHFGHRGIISMCGRPFADVEEMDEALIARWNERVRGNDTVYHLGDLTMGASAERGAEIFKRLKGRKHLVVGNHDALKVRSLGWASEPQARVLLRHPGEKIPMVLDHYALRTWPSAHHGAIHLYGHSHGALPGVGRSLDVGVDCWDYRPVTLEELRPTLERQHEEFERQREAERMFRECAARGDPETALAILRRVPDVVPEADDEPTRATRIVSDPSVLEGQPHVAGTTVLVRDVLDMLDDGRLDFEVRALLELPDDAVAAVREWAVPAARVVEDREVMSGEPCVSGTRVPARTVLAYLKAGHSDREIFADYPSLPVDGITAVRRWATELGFGLPERDQ